MMERVPEDELSYVIQIMQGVNGLSGVTETKGETNINPEQFIMSATERRQQRMSGSASHPYVNKKRNLFI